MTRIPPLRSPTKKSHRKQFRPSFWLIPSQSTSTPTPEEHNEHGDEHIPASEAISESDAQFWLPQDIFKSQPPEVRGTSVALDEDVPLWRNADDEAEPVAYPQPDEIEKPLDEDAIESQLVGS